MRRRFIYDGAHLSIDVVIFHRYRLYICILCHNVDWSDC